MCGHVHKLVLEKGKRRHHDFPDSEAVQGRPREEEEEGKGEGGEDTCVSFCTLFEHFSEILKGS